MLSLLRFSKPLESSLLSRLLIFCTRLDDLESPKLVLGNFTDFFFGRNVLKFVEDSGLGLGFIETLLNLLFLFNVL